MAKASVEKAGMPKKVSEQKGVSEFRLANNLKVLISENHSAPVATLLVIYKVGSRNEGVGYTGATHFLEHMLFKGTAEHNAEKGNSLDDLLTQIGAYWNATTWFDRTSYYEVVPTEFFELCVKLEADRMRNLRLRQEDHDSEMSVVRNELERGENQPEEALEKELYAIAFREHPYHHPTIGWRSDVEGVPMDRLREFYNTFYWPENATVIALGDFKTEEALALIDKYFGAIESAPSPIPQVYTVEPPQEGERRFEITRAGDMVRVWLGYHVPEAAHPDNYAVSAARQILGSTYERSSRLYKALIDTSLAADVFARHDDLRDPGLLMVGAMVNPDVDPQKVEDILLNEIARLAKEPVSDQELARIKASNRKGTILAKADPSSLAFMLGEAESRADFTWLLNYDDNFDQVTKDDIMRVARTYFKRSNRTVGYFYPKDEVGQNSDLDLDADLEEDNEDSVPAAIDHGASNQVYTDAELKELLTWQSTPVTIKFEKAKESEYLSKVKRVVLKNGLTLLLMNNPGTESLGIAINLRAGRYFTHGEPGSPSEMLGDLLSRGSKNFDKLKIAENLEEMGIPGGLEVYVDNYRVGMGTHLAVEDLPAYLDMVSDLLINPLLPSDELEKLKIEWNARYVESKNSTKSMAWNKLRQALYSEDHPFYDEDFDKQLKDLAKIDRQKLVDIHARLYDPASMIVTIVGDIDLDKAHKLVDERLGTWTNAKAMPLSQRTVVIPETALPKKFEEIAVYLPEKSSLDIVLAHPCQVTRASSDFYATRIANAALGQDTITSRLGQVVRDRAGLTYGIYSGFSDTAFGGAPWSVSLTTNPANLKRAVQLTRVTLKDFMDRGIDVNDLEKERGRALGSFKVGLSSSLGIARVLTEFEFLGLGAVELDHISERYLSLTKEKVDEALRKYIHPDNAVLVASGTIAK